MTLLVTVTVAIIAVALYLLYHAGKWLVTKAKDSSLGNSLKDLGDFDVGDFGDSGGDD